MRFMLQHNFLPSNYGARVSFFNTTFSKPLSTRISALLLGNQQSLDPT